MILSPLRTLAGSAALLLASTISPVHAAPITPLYGTFGSFPITEFGGDGIPNNQVAFTEVALNSDETLTVALAATQRLSNPPLMASDGVYTATAGQNSGVPGVFGTTSTWNFSFYLGITGNGQSTIGSLGLRLLYDLDPGVGTDATELGVINLSAAPSQLIEDSQNPAFAYLSTGAPFVIPPAYTPFDPLATGEYSFAIGTADSPEYLVAINVNVIDPNSTPVPLPGSLALMALGLLGLRFRRNA